LLKLSEEDELSKDRKASKAGASVVCNNYYAKFDFIYMSHTRNIQLQQSQMRGHHCYIAQMVMMKLFQHHHYSSVRRVLRILAIEFIPIGIRIPSVNFAILD